GLMLALANLLPGQEPSPRERAVRKVIDQFFAAYGRKDLEAVLALWDKETPGLDQRKKALAEVFAATGPVTVNGLDFKRVRIRDDEARVDLFVILEGTDRKTGKQHPAFKAREHTLELVRTDGAWKVRAFEPTASYYPALYRKLDELQERRRLLVENRSR